MGIDVHALNLVSLAARRLPLGDVLTIGRQSMSVSPDVVRQRLGVPVAESGYCEPLLRALGADSVESIDYSAYEGATHVADFGKKVDLPGQYDTLVDAGSLEHVFDVACAFRNMVALCRVGGRILHLLPVNNLSGHGFWQFSSDLMHSIYSAENGFVETEVYYASSLDPDRWYKVPEARSGVRVEMISIEPIILLCMTRKAEERSSMAVVQPFYMRKWAATGDAPPAETSGARRWLGWGVGVFGRRARLVLRNAFRVTGLMLGLSRYSLKSSHFQKIEVAKLLASSSR